jgi:hypothetical protein
MVPVRFSMVTPAKFPTRCWSPVRWLKTEDFPMLGFPNRKKPAGEDWDISGGFDQNTAGVFLPDSDLKGPVAENQRPGKRHKAKKVPEASGNHSYFGKPCQKHRLRTGQKPEFLPGFEGKKGTGQPNLD